MSSTMVNEVSVNKMRAASLGLVDLLGHVKEGVRLTLENGSESYQ